MMHLEVAVAAPLEQTLTYSLAEAKDLEPEVDQRKKYIGRRVLVWLGRRKVTGYVLDIVEVLEETPYKIKNISRFLDAIPLFHENSVPFYRWVANYYHYPVGMVIKTALPGGLAPKSRKKLVLQIDSDTFSALFSSGYPAWAARLAAQGELSPVETAELLGDPAAKKTVASLVKKKAINIASVLAKDGVQEKSEVCYGFRSPLSCPPEKIDNSREGLIKYRDEMHRDSGIDLKLSEVKACTAFTISPGKIIERLLR